MSVEKNIVPSLASSLVRALAEIGGATKDKVNPHFKSKYADLASVVDAIKPVLARHGLAFTQATEPSETGVIVETFVWSANALDKDCYGPSKHSLGKLYVPANKNDAQGFGSALTYARRYSLMTAFGVPAEDDDGNAAARSAPRTVADRHPDGAAIEAARPISDEQRDMIQAIAPGAGKTLQGICEAYKIPALTALTESQAAKLIERLKSETKTKEPANA